MKPLFQLSKIPLPFLNLCAFWWISLKFSNQVLVWNHPLRYLWPCLWGFLWTWFSLILLNLTYVVKYVSSLSLWLISHASAEWPTNTVIGSISGVLQKELGKSGQLRHDYFKMLWRIGISQLSCNLLSNSPFFHNAINSGICANREIIEVLCILTKLIHSGHTFLFLVLPISTGHQNHSFLNSGTLSAIFSIFLTTLTTKAWSLASTSLKFWGSATCHLHMRRLPHRHARSYPIHCHPF